MRIEVSDRPAAPLVPPAQSYFLRENLRLRLLSARIALLTRDDASFRADVDRGRRAGCKQYFDLRAKPVQALQSTLKQVAATPMPGAVPDLSRSLDALRVLPARARSARRDARRRQ